MVEILTNEEFEKMKAAGKILQHVFKACRDEIKPGISTHDVDKLCYDIIRSYDAIPSFLNYGQPPFPGTICASVNDEVVHGIPRKTRILMFPITEDRVTAINSKRVWQSASNR